MFSPCVGLLANPQEAEAAQKQFVQLRREHETLQNSIRSQELLRKGELDVLQAQYDAVQHALGEKTSALETAAGGLTYDRWSQQQAGF